MGRRLPFADEVEPWGESLRDQCRSFLGVCEAAYLKPHGAWYGLVPFGGFTELDAIWQEVCIKARLPIMISHLYKSCSGELGALGTEFIFEGFPERGCATDGSLLPRSSPRALLTDLDEIGAHALSLAPLCDSLCVHGDSPGCVETLAHVRQTLERAGHKVGF